MNKGEQFRSIVRSKPKSAVRLGDIAKDLMEYRISPQQARFEPIAEAWSQLLPAELRRHCKIVDISGGRLKVQVDLPSYRYELQLCSSQLVAEMQRQCPRARIKQIKFIVGL